MGMGVGQIKPTPYRSDIYPRGKVDPGSLDPVDADESCRSWWIQLDPGGCFQISVK
jgi:hypothetical protein